VSSYVADFYATYAAYPALKIKIISRLPPPSAHKTYFAIFLLNEEIFLSISFWREDSGRPQALFAIREEWD
jgi:hypothetical protein